MTPDSVILNMLREVIDLRVCVAASWAETFGRTTEEMEALLQQVRQERALEQVAA
jgi:hypothetical protein